MVNAEARIASLEQRVSTLEAQVLELKNQFQPQADGRGTLRRAMDALAAAVTPSGLTFVNHGHKGRYIKDANGVEHLIYLATSRNHASDTGGFMGGWHTINEEDAENPAFEAFILSVEDERGVPVFFVLTPDQMHALLADKRIDASGLRHFYIGREAPGIDRFVDRRDGVNTDMTPYVNAWNALTFRGTEE